MARHRIIHYSRGRGGEVDNPIPGTAFHGLSVEDLERATRPRVDLVVYHVLESLVVCGPDEHLTVHLAPCVAVV